MSPETTSESELAANLSLALFQLNGQMLAVGDDLARTADITLAWWQVLGAVTRQPRTVSGIARQMGITRQAVQRVANILVDRGLLEALPNPDHRRAPLLSPTDTGRDAVRRIAPAQTEFANALVNTLGHDRCQQITDALVEMSKAVDRITTTQRTDRPTADGRTGVKRPRRDA